MKEQEEAECVKEAGQVTKGLEKENIKRAQKKKQTKRKPNVLF